MRPILHLLLLAAPSAVLNLRFVEDYAVVCGVTDTGALVLPVCSDTRYLVPCGVDGLPFLAQLGNEGGAFDFTFPVPVVSYVVATNSESMPVPQLIAAPVVSTPFVVKKVDIWNQIVTPGGSALIVGSMEIRYALPGQTDPTTWKLNVYTPVGLYPAANGAEYDARVAEVLLTYPIGSPFTPHGPLPAYVFSSNAANYFGEPMD